MKAIYLSLFAGMVLISCKKETVEPSEMIVGKWIIDNSELLGSSIPGDGSYLVFDACSGSVCTGTDFKASDTTSGSFTYNLAADASTISIVDTMSEGGSYNGTWDILELTESKFRLIAETGLFGTFKMECSKE